MNNTNNNSCNNGCSDQNHDKPEQEKIASNCCAELERNRERCLYLTAEFENYKKRIAREKQEWISVAQTDLIADFLPVVDDIERALEQIQQEKITPEISKHLEGFTLIYKEFFKLLDKYQISQIEPTTNFDPELHEALMQVESAEHTAGEIINVLQKGYKYKDKIIRPAKVSVAK